MPHQYIAILDFGSQYTHLIARRFREIGVLSKIFHPADFGIENQCIGIVLSGGPGSVGEADFAFDRSILASNIPILGLCFGHQTLAHEFGGTVKPGDTREYGRAKVKIGNSELFSGLDASEQVWMSHGDSVVTLPQGFEVIASTEECPIAAMQAVSKKMYGLQFHPEVAHTKNGKQILSNFALNICHAQGDWDMTQVKDEILTTIQKKVGDRKVFMLVSGGVDSTVAYALLQQALGAEQVYGLYIDTGFMRKNETELIQTSLQRAGFKKIHTENSSVDFFNALKGVIEPETKRKIIGAVFIEVQKKVAKKLGLDSEDWMLGQGTIYPDTIESGGTKHADTIKTHHNRVAEITALIEQGSVIEPLADLYKDEVRNLGKQLGLPSELIDRHPFPGPGLAIRILCSDGEYFTTKAEAEAKELQNSLQQSKFNSKVLPVRSVGVQGDNRTYAQPVVLIGVCDWDVLDLLATKITNTYSSINRVLFTTAIESKSKLLPTTLTIDRVDIVRNIDAVVHDFMIENSLYSDIWQFPVVLIPFGVDGKESVVLRPIVSDEAMTAHFYKMDLSLVQKLFQRILSTGLVSNVFYDITNKPPGTIEWE